MGTPAPAGRGLSLGVEEEFFLVDPATGRLLASNHAVAETARHLGTELDLELMSAQVETKTPVCWSMDEVRSHLSTSRTSAAAAALRANARLVATGASLRGGHGQRLTDRPRYRLLAERFGPLAREHAVCGGHVHVGIPDRETGVQVSNHLRPWLPVLLALTANSPVHQGRDTGYASWRSVIWARWPCSGAPPYFTSAEHYDSVVATLADAGVILGPGMVYWDVRLSHHLPTVEVRVSDVPSTVEESALLAALVRALVATAIRAVRAGRAAVPVPGEVLRTAYWRAARDGLTGTAVDVFTSRPATPGQLLVKLLRHVDADLAEVGERRQVETALRRVLAEGNGASWQRRAYAGRGRVGDVVAAAVQRTLCHSAQCPPGQPTA